MRRKKEIWVEVDPGGFYEGYYEVSNYGRWKIKPRIVNSILADRRHIKKERITTGTNSNGYRTVQMKKEGIKKQRDLHILVAIHFVPNPKPDEYKIVCHKDDIRWNNYFENLQWGTQKQNVHDAVRNGKTKVRIGSPILNKPLSENEVKKIKAMYSTGRFSAKNLAKVLGVVPEKVLEVLNV